MHVTLRNKKNIGLICFMLVSSSYFGLLCRTITLLWQKNKFSHEIIMKNFKSVNVTPGKVIIVAHDFARAPIQKTCHVVKCGRLIP